MGRNIQVLLFVEMQSLGYKGDVTQCSMFIYVSFAQTLDQLHILFTYGRNNFFYDKLHYANVAEVTHVLIFDDVNSKTLTNHVERFLRILHILVLMKLPKMSISFAFNLFFFCRQIELGTLCLTYRNVRTKSSHNYEHIVCD